MKIETALEKLAASGARAGLAYEGLKYASNKREQDKALIAYWQDESKRERRFQRRLIAAILRRVEREKAEAHRMGWNSRSCFNF